MQLALDAQPKWALKRLTETYVTLRLADIGREIGVKEEEEVRALVLNMVSGCGKRIGGMRARGR